MHPTKKSSSKKLSTSEFIMRAVARHGGHYDYSKVNYTGSKGKVCIICKEHGEFMQQADNHLAGKGCQKCRAEKLSESTAMTRGEFIARVIQQHGGTYDVSKIEFTHRAKPIFFVCVTHGRVKGVADTFVKKGCSKCNIEKRIENRKIDDAENTARIMNAAVDAFSIIGYQRANKVTYATISCKKHGTLPAKVPYLVKNGTCPKCASERSKRKPERATSDFIKEAVGVHGDRYDYARSVYNGVSRKMAITCSEHGEFLQSPSKHLDGQGCPKCGWEKRGQSLRSNTDEFLEKLNTVHGSEYDVNDIQYVNNHTKIVLTCKEHGEFKSTPNRLLAGARCPRCARVGPSKAQLEMFEFLSQHCTVEIERKMNNSTHRYDMFIAEKNIGVEYHGLIWHSSRFQKDTKSDFKKHKLALSEGVRLIHIYEDEWATKRAVVERVLLSALGKLERIYARKTSIVEVGPSRAAMFFEKNHLQGAPKSTRFIGLEYEGDLVACMSFGTARSVRTNIDKGLVELQRYAATKTIVGGASKLFAEFLKTTDCHTIISYSDERVFSGNMYAQLGFKLEHITPPDYKYTTGRVKDGRAHKSRFQHKHLTKMFDNYDTTLTESENCKNNGWFQIFDCGKKRWCFTR